MPKIIQKGIFQGKISGVISSEIIGAEQLSFLIIPDEKIEGFPDEIEVRCQVGHYKKGDRVLINGRIIKSSYEDIETYLFYASYGIYNITSNTGTPMKKD